MLTPPQRNIELNQEKNYFSDSYLLDIYSLVWDFLPYERAGKFAYALELWSIATKSITFQLKQLIEEIGNKSLSIIEWVDYILDELQQDHSYWSTFEQFKDYLIKIVEHAKSENKTLILGFSSIWSYILLQELFAIIPKLKNIYPNIVFVIWGSDFNDISDERFLDIIFEWWIDIINVWWWAEFVDFIWNIWARDRFYRDEKGLLVLETQKNIPKNLIFWSSNKDLSKVEKWSKIDLISYYDKLMYILHFSIKNSSCLNSCYYCANYIHSGELALRDLDIEESISSFNQAISSINDEDFSVAIDTPNPLQYIDRFYKFIQNINLDKVTNLWFFADFIWLWDDKKFNKLLIIVEYLKNKYPNIVLNIAFALDAIHEKWDGDYIWRTNWKRLASQEKISLWLSKFSEFIGKYWDDENVNISYNLIFHPNMDLWDYLERFKLMEILDNYTVWAYALVPQINTKISEDHKWYYLPEYELINYINAKELLKHIQEPSYWWYFYNKSCLLDAYLYTRVLGINPIFQEMLSSETNGFDVLLKENKNKILLIFLELGLQKLVIFINDLENGEFSLCEGENLQDIKNIIMNKIKFSVYYIDFILKREKYIMENNSDYNDPDMGIFLQDLKEMKLKFEEFIGVVSICK